MQSKGYTRWITSEIGADIHTLGGLRCEYRAEKAASSVAYTAPELSFWRNIHTALGGSEHKASKHCGAKLISKENAVLLIAIPRVIATENNWHRSGS